VLGAGDINEQLRVQGLDALPSTPEQFATFVRDEIAKWAKVIKVSGAKADH
jgi:tripartite-type tricarboxylate transporter receptor subunit TctC